MLNFVTSVTIYICLCFLLSSLLPVKPHFLHLDDNQTHHMLSLESLYFTILVYHFSCLFYHSSQLSSHSFPALDSSSFSSLVFTPPLSSCFPFPHPLLLYIYNQGVGQVEI